MAWLTKTSAPRAAAAPQGYRSLALRALLDGLRAEPRPAVLDLGPPISANVKFLSALQCRVRVVDLYRSLSAEPIESRRPEAMVALAERLLPLAPDERFDALLAWDAFDYLRADQVSTLMARVLPRLRASAHVLVLVSTLRQVPALPARYRILDRENLSCERPARASGVELTRACPRYTQSDLAHMLPGLSVRRCYLLRSGIQEYLLAPGT